MIEPDAVRDEDGECRVCENVVHGDEGIEHPAYSGVFCSRACLNKFLNRVGGYE